MSTIFYILGTAYYKVALVHLIAISLIRYSLFSFHAYFQEKLSLLLSNPQFDVSIRQNERKEARDDAEPSAAGQ
jgi:hypothetical protein